MTEYDFHTTDAIAWYNGQLCALQLKPRNGVVREFVDPDTHTDRARWHDPRNEDTTVYESRSEEIMAQMFGNEPLPVPADVWDTYREDYQTRDTITKQWYADLLTDASDALTEHVPVGELPDGYANLHNKVEAIAD